MIKVKHGICIAYWKADDKLFKYVIVGFFKFPKCAIIQPKTRLWSRPKSTVMVGDNNKKLGRHRGITNPSWTLVETNM